MGIKSLPPERKLVNIEEGMLVQMANNQAILKEFPFLKSLQSFNVAKTSCNTCSGGRNGGQKAIVFTSAKQTLASMGNDKKLKLKKLLNAQKIRIRYKQGARIIEQTF